ncbi:MAG: oligosaccharide flippase family protein, partial [Gammaproteobacteria bacterium]
MSDLSLSEAPITVAPIAPRSGAGLYFIASLLAQAIALVRYVVLARLLGPEQLGLAATLVVTGSFFDLISDTGSDRFLIQDREGDHQAVQKLVQLTWVSRGVAIALCLVVFAIPLSEFYRTPRIAVGFVWLALSPLILGFTHLDIRRAQRDHNFRSEAVCMLAAETVSLIATATAAWLTHSFTAILYGLISRSLVMVLTSHIVANRSYWLAWSREHGPRLVKFAVPLMLSGLVLFIGSQGDRIMVARQLGMSAAGQYAAVILLIIYPTSIVMRYTHAIFLPMVAAARDDSARRNRISD